MVNAMLGIVQALLEVDRLHIEDEQAVIAKAERQLRLVALGMAGWRGTPQS
jgi:hypothetical protein